VDDPRTELPQRRTVAHVLMAAAAVMAVPTVATAFAAGTAEASTAPGGWAMAVVMALVLVVVPLLLVRSILSRHTYVSEDAVTVVVGERVRQQIAFDDITAVKVRYSGRGGETFRNDKVFLTGGLREGRGAVLVSRFHVDTLQPLLTRLAAEVEQRPELLDGEVERDYFEHALRTTP
jgi:hypothetical protein